MSPNESISCTDELVCYLFCVYMAGFPTTWIYFVLLYAVYRVLASLHLKSSLLPSHPKKEPKEGYQLQDFSYFLGYFCLISCFLTKRGKRVCPVFGKIQVRRIPGLSSGSWQGKYIRGCTFSELFRMPLPLTMIGFFMYWFTGRTRYSSLLDSRFRTPLRVKSSCCSPLFEEVERLESTFPAMLLACAFFSFFWPGSHLPFC